MKKIHLISLLIIFSLFLCSIAFAIDSSWKLVAKLAGTVQYQKQGDNAWVAIWSQRMLQDGDMIKTLEKSRAAVRLSDQSVVTVGEETIIDMAEFKINDSQRKCNIKITIGSIRVKVEKFLGNDQFEIETPNATLAARGTDFYVEQEKVTKDDGAGLTKVALFSGSLQINTTTETTLLTYGQTAFIDTAGNIILNPASFPLPVDNVEVFKSPNAQDVIDFDTDLMFPGTVPGQLPPFYIPQTQESVPYVPCQ